MKTYHISVLLVMLVMVSMSVGMSDWSRFVVSYCKRFAVRDLQILTVKSKNTTDNAEVLELVQEILDILHIRVQTVSSLNNNNERLLNNQYNPNAQSVLMAPSRETLASIKAQGNKTKTFGAGNRWLIVIPENDFDYLMTDAMAKSPAFTDSDITVAAMQDDGDATLQEVYRIDKNTPLIKGEKLLGFWNRHPQFGMDPFDVKQLPMIFDRRRDLGGHRLRIIIDQIDTMSGNFSGKGIEVGLGFHAEVFVTLQTILNFTYTVKVSELEQVYGEIAKDKRTWIGMVSGLLNGSYDVLVGPFSITTSRQDVIDYSTPSLIDGIKIFLRWSETGGSGSSWWRAVVMPFNWDTWTSLVIAMPLISIIMYFTNRFVCTEDTTAPFSDQFWIFFSALCQKGVEPEDTPIYVSGRLVMWFGTFFFVFAYWCYGALFTSFLTVRELTIPFQSVEEILPREDWKLCAMPWMTSLLFTKEDPNEVVREMNDKITNQNCIYEKEDEAVPYALKSRRAVLANVLAINRVFNVKLEYACQISYIPIDYFTDNQAMGFPKGTPYLAIINYQLLKMQTTGVLDALENRWNRVKPYSCGGISEPVEAFSAIKVLAPCIILAGGIVLAVICFLLEHLQVSNEHRKQREEIRKIVAPYFAPPKHEVLF